MRLKTNGLLWLAPLAFVLPPAVAGTNFCSGSYSFDPSTGIPSTTGCEQADKIFGAFSYYNNSGTPPAENAVFVTFSGSAPGGPITDTFSSAGWINTVNTGSLFLYNYTQVDLTSNPGWVLTRFDLNPGSISFPSTCLSAPGGPFCDSVQIITTICTNLNTNTCTGTDSNYGQMNYSASATFAPSQTYCYATCNSGSNSGATAVTFDPSLGITSVFVTSFIIINNYDGQPVTLDGYANDFFEAQASGTTTPEPSAFLLLGGGLTALGLVRMRGRRR